MLTHLAGMFILGAPLEQLEHFERYRDKGLGWHVERPELLELRDFVLQRLDAGG